MKYDDLEEQDFLFMKCLSEKICKRHVNIDIKKPNNNKSDLNKIDNVVNAFDLDEISFLTGINFNIVKDTGAKLLRMGLTNKILWEDKASKEDRYLWYLSENGEKFLDKNR
tara:strand:+ start:1991 stop:2323 length:333 start_codon:yes stop_codon:yes gene_type:complete